MFEWIYTVHLNERAQKSGVIKVNSYYKFKIIILRNVMPYSSADRFLWNTGSYLIAWYHILEDNNLHSCLGNNLKYRKLFNPVTVRKRNVYHLALEITEYFRPVYIKIPTGEQWRRFLMQHQMERGKLEDRDGDGRKAWDRI
jgi:hypothetical protein